MKKLLKIASQLLAITIVLNLSACNSDSTNDNFSPESSGINPDLSESITDDNAKISADREGNPINLPKNIQKVISIGSSNTEILSALGFGDKIIATDTFSANVEGLKTDLLYFDTYTPDGEQIISLEPDVIFVTGMSKSAGNEPFKPVSDTGICIIYIPSSTSIEEIKNDIIFIANVMGAKSKGEELITEIDTKINEIKKIGDSIPNSEKKSVYFEIETPPYMYSFGKGVFLNEMIELIGAVNIFNNEENWITVSNEAVLDANPDIILTNVSYVENAVEEIKLRTGWEEISAIKNNQVFLISTDASSRPSHKIIIALEEMAKAIYPDKYL